MTSSFIFIPSEFASLSYQSVSLLIVVCAICRYTGSRRLRIDVKNPYSLEYSGYNRSKKNVLIIHGFNGTESRSPITILRNGKYIKDD